MLEDYVKFTDEVSEGLRSNLPIVALETTYLAAGLPYPKNIETTLESEQLIRQEGAIPASLGIVDGMIKCGLEQEEIEYFSNGSNIFKAIDRDIPLMLEKGVNAAFSLSATLSVCSKLGIHTAVSGAIGGVGAHANIDFDISADLQALKQYRCITVCSGTKSFMDVSATLEYLETHGVLVAGYRIDTFPYFISIDSGLKLDWRAESFEEIARVYKRKIDLGFEGGIIVGIPAPTEYALPNEDNERAVRKALEVIQQRKITGKSVTHELFKIFHQETGGRSILADSALIKNDCATAAQLAVALQRILDHPEENLPS